MTISRAEPFTVRFTFSPRRGPSVAWASQHGYALLRLEDGDGAVGWGETYLVPGAVAALEAAWPSLRGRRAGEAAAIGVAAAMSAIACLPPVTRSPVQPLPLLGIGLDENSWCTDLAALPRPGMDGFVTLEAGPGLGIDVDEACLRRRAESVIEMR